MKNIVYFLVALFFAQKADAQHLKWGEKRTFKRLNSHIEYLASDRLEGRSTGSDGEWLSAQYVAKWFEKYKLKPMGENGTWYQTFSVTTLRIADTKTKMNLNGAEQKLFAGFYPLSYSTNEGSYQGEAVNAGFGIASEDLNYNDYDSIDVKGKAVIINIGSPDGIHPHSKYSAWHGIQIRVDEAIKRGAKAVIFVKTAKNVEPPSGELSTKIKPSSIPVVYVNKTGQEIPKTWNVQINVKMIVDFDEGHNVIGFMDNGAKNTIVIGAHHDHLGHGEHGGSLAEDPTQIHNGADDNASGTAALIELARCLRKDRKARSNNYLFIAFSGEEMGLLGSKYFVNNATIDTASINYMLNMDMVGKLDSARRTLIINGAGTSPAWKEGIAAIDTSDKKIKKIKTTESGLGASDHTSFYLANIPAIHFFTGQHMYYHKPTDDISILYLKGEVYVIEAMIQLIEELDDNGNIAFTKTKDVDARKSRSFNVTLGIMPDYVYDGEGLRVDGVRAGKPGEAAGLQKGDVIISLHGQSIKSMQDYIKLLGVLEKGQKTTMKVIRDGEIVEMDVQF